MSISSFLYYLVSKHELSAYSLLALEGTQKNWKICLLTIRIHNLFLKTKLMEKKAEDGGLFSIF